MNQAADPAQNLELAQALVWCKQVTRRRAGNFYYGLMLMPGPRRAAMYAVYAFMRVCDDLADEAPASADAAPPSSALTLAKIAEFRATMQAVCAGGPAPAEPLWTAFRWLVRAYPIHPAHLHAMLDGQVADLTPHEYVTFAQLYDYCYQVASTVGLVCINVWGAGQNQEAQTLAESRGIALQLTNILRDVVEDARRGRVYLPTEELRQFGLEPQAFREQMGRAQAGAGFDQLMRFQINRARDYYEKSRGLEKHLDPACRPTCWALMEIYRQLLEKISADPRAVLRRRVRLGTVTKLRIGVKAKFKF